MSMSTVTQIQQAVTHDHNVIDGEFFAFLFYIYFVGGFFKNFKILKDKSVEIQIVELLTKRDLVLIMKSNASRASLGCGTGLNCLRLFKVNKNFK